MEIFWKEIKNNIRTFNYDDENLHIIPISNPNGGSEKYYICINEDGHFLNTGNSEILTEDKIIEKYKISL